MSEPRKLIGLNPNREILDKEIFSLAVHGNDDSKYQIWVYILREKPSGEKSIWPQWEFRELFDTIEEAVSVANASFPELERLEVEQ